MAGKEIYLTPEGKKKLEKELKFYKEVKRQEVITAIGVARDFGDLSENSEYDRAKEEQAKVESKISEMEMILRDAVILKKQNKTTDEVIMGSEIEIYDEDFDEKFIYKLVGKTESDPLNGFISNESPVGEALLGGKVGDIIKVNTPAGISNIKILSIK